MRSGVNMNLNLDELKYSIGEEDYRINQYITIYNPYVYEVKDFGEDQYFNTLNIFTRRPYDMAVVLFDAGIDYQSITDWDLFFNTITQVPIELTCILFGRINFTEFVSCINPKTNLQDISNWFLG